LTDEEMQTVLEEVPPPGDKKAIEYIRGILSEPSEKSELLWRLNVVAPRSAYPRDASEQPRAQWERIGLSPDIELHVRRPLSHPQNKAVNRILEAAREILQEEAP
jgi:hypothetical protein